MQSGIERLTETNLVGQSVAFSGDNFNPQIECISLKLVELGSRHNQGIRNRELSLDNQDVSTISGLVAENRLGSLTDSLTGVVEYSNSRDTIIIPNGWGTNRWMVVATFKEAKGTGDLYYVYQGYTRHNEDVSVNQLNNHITFAPDSSFIINKLSTYAAINGVLVPRENDNLFTSNLGLETGNVLQANRPKDIVERFSAHELLATHNHTEDGINNWALDDRRSSIGIQSLKSDTLHGVGTAYFSRLVGSVAKGHQLAGSGGGSAGTVAASALTEHGVYNSPVIRDLALMYNGQDYNAATFSEIPFEYLIARHRDLANETRVFQRDPYTDNSLVQTLTGETQELISDDTVETKYINQIIEMASSFMFQNNVSSFSTIFTNDVVPSAQNGWETSKFEKAGIEGFIIENIGQGYRDELLYNVNSNVLLELNNIFGSFRYTCFITAVDAFMVVKLSINGAHTICGTGSTFADSTFSSNIGDATSLASATKMLTALNLGIRDGVAFNQEEKLRNASTQVNVNPIVEVGIENILI